MKLYKYVAVAFLFLLLTNNFAYSKMRSDDIQQTVDSFNESKILEVFSKYNYLDTMFIVSVSDKDFETAILLIEYGVDPNLRNGSTLLEIAVRDNEIYLVEYLLSKGADPRSFYTISESYSYDSKNAICDAIILNRIEIIKLFHEYGFDFNDNCFIKAPHSYNCESSILTPLQVALAHKRSEIAKYLISIGVEI